MKKTNLNFDKSEFKKNENGMLYKFDEIHEGAKLVEMGEVLVCEVVMSIENTVLFENMGHPQRMFAVKESTFKGDLPEGLLMMHKGDEATFGVDLDMISEMVAPGQMPVTYIPNKGMKMFYQVKLHDIISREQMMAEQAQYQKALYKRQMDEPKVIEEYVKSNHIEAKPDSDGLYVIVTKKGNGEAVANGKKVKIDYTGRLMSGQIFDTSIESIAKEGGVYDSRRTYGPLEYEVGKMGLIKGWDRGAMGQTEGSKVTLIIPSALGYGEQGAGGMILPYTPLVFELDIVEVK